MPFLVRANETLTGLRELAGELDIERDRLYNSIQAVDRLAISLWERLDHLENIVTTLEGVQQAAARPRVREHFWVCIRLPEVEGTERLGILRASREAATRFYGEGWQGTDSGWEVHRFTTYDGAVRFWWDSRAREMDRPPYHERLAHGEHYRPRGTAGQMPG